MQYWVLAVEGTTLHNQLDNLAFMLYILVIKDISMHEDSKEDTYQYKIGRISLPKLRIQQK